MLAEAGEAEEGSMRFWPPPVDVAGENCWPSARGDEDLRPRRQRLERDGLRLTSRKSLPFYNDFRNTEPVELRGGEVRGTVYIVNF